MTEEEQQELKDLKATVFDLSRESNELQAKFQPVQEALNKAVARIQEIEAPKPTEVEVMENNDTI